MAIDDGSVAGVLHFQLHEELTDVGTDPGAALVRIGDAAQLIVQTRLPFFFPHFGFSGLTKFDGKNYDL